MSGVCGVVSVVVSQVLSVRLLFSGVWGRALYRKYNTKYGTIRDTPPALIRRFPFPAVVGSLNHATKQNADLNASNDRL